MERTLINRDISWLYFNERVLLEAANPNVPLLERLKFLSIYSANLDEFYRVRIPVVMAINEIEGSNRAYNIGAVKEMVNAQQQLFGKILREEIIPGLAQEQVELIYNKPIPADIKAETTDYFFTQIAAFLQPIYLANDSDFFPENNKIYLAVKFQLHGIPKNVVLNIPSEGLGRFVAITSLHKTYVVFLDDIIKENIHLIFSEACAGNCYSFKVTRDAELDLADEYKGDIAEKIERQIELRDFGLATRFLYDAAMPKDDLETIIAALKLGNSNIIEGGSYHNLRDFADFPLKLGALSYDKWPSIDYGVKDKNLFREIDKEDMLLHVPYHSYNTVLHFFNQAALDEKVTDIFVTLYRVAGDSKIAHALISAAKNGKSVTVFVELKARFDEANNIRWAKKMKTAGVKIIYSIPGLKVHAKIGLVKRTDGERVHHYGLLSTGNFNETTAKFYTDHILLTARKELLQEIELLFIFLEKRRKPLPDDRFRPQHLLVAQFNLQEKFTALIEAETRAARQGKPAAITIKLNNLEEKVLMGKLYEAADAGVKVNLIIRGTCRLNPEQGNGNISIRRIVDRYLEHGRVFIFHNGGEERFYLGSADWMNRNIYRRIEVCFPLYSRKWQVQLKKMILLQLNDNVKAVLIGNKGENLPIVENGASVHSQFAIYNFIKET